MRRSIKLTDTRKFQFPTQFLPAETKVIIPLIRSDWQRKEVAGPDAIVMFLDNAAASAISNNHISNTGEPRTPGLVARNRSSVFLDRAKSYHPEGEGVH